MRPQAVLWGTVLAGCTPSLERPVPEDLDLRARTVEDLPAPREHVRIVELAGRFELPDRLPPDERQEHLIRRAKRIAEAREGWRSRLPAGVEVLQAYENFPLVSVAVPNDDAEAALRKDPRVLAVHVEAVERVSDVASLALIEQPVAEDEGFVGAGTSIVVLDTGANYRHGDFGSCTDVGVPASCRVVYARDFAAEDNALDAHGHGTNVTATAGSVAPAADLIPLDVFTGGGAYGSHILAALDWTVTHQDTYAIAAVNMSLGSGSYTAPCNNYFATALDTVHAAGILAATASGNDAWSNAIASPACNASAFSVGAVYDTAFGSIGYSSCADTNVVAGDVTCFSNAAGFLDLLAPGALVTNGGITMAGTSQATPHVAGAAAVLRSAWPDATTAEIEQALIDGGLPTLDPRNQHTFPRLDLPGSLTFVPEPVDTGAPPEPILSGSLILDGGAPATSDPWVTLTLDAPGATEVCVSNNDSCAAWQPMVTELGWRLSAGEGERVVTAWFRDATRISVPVTATIALDDSPPTPGTVTPVPGDGRAHLVWSGFDDAITEVVEYQVHVLADAPRGTFACIGTPDFVTSDTSLTVPGLTNGDTYAVSVCGTDAVGHVSPAARTTFVPAPEDVLPFGSVTLDGGAPVTADRVVDVELSATDPSGVTEACLSTTPSACVRWFPMADHVSWTLPDRPGTIAVFAWFRDPWGQVGEPAEGSIVLDNRAPRDGTVDVAPSATGVELVFTDFLDGETGVVDYQVYAVPGDTPPEHCTGTPIWSGPTTTADLTVTPGAYAFRVCAMDGAGNQSGGSTATGSTATDIDGPTGTLQLASAAPWTRDRAVTVDVQATDESGVAEICVSSTDRCTSWLPYRTSLLHLLPDRQGDHTVHVHLRDVHGNRSELTGTIGLDTLPPISGELQVSSLGGSVEVRWDDAFDDGSGLASFALHALESRVPPDCASAPTWTGTTRQASLSLDPTVAWGFRLCTLDIAGNTDSSALTFVAGFEDLEPPVGTVELAQGADTVTTASVHVALSATDASEGIEYCLSPSAASCRQWAPLVPETSWTLPDRAGDWTVFAHFRDAWGNRSVASDTVTHSTHP